MSAQLLEMLLQQAGQLTPDEQLLLATRLIERARQAATTAAAPRRRRKWREIRGLAKPSLFGEDAQAFISRTRREDTEHRERMLKREP